MKQLRFPLFVKVSDYCYALRVAIVLAYVFITTNNAHIYIDSIKNKRLRRLAKKHPRLLIIVFFPLIPLIFFGLRIYLLMLRAVNRSLGLIERICVRIPWSNDCSRAFHLEKRRNKTRETLNRAKIFYEQLVVKLRNNYTVYKSLVHFFNKHRKLRCISVMMGCGALGTLFANLIAIAWICEKLSLSLSLSYSGRVRVPNFFEYSVLNYSPVCRRENFSRLKEPITHLARSAPRNFDFLNFMVTYALSNISSDYGYRVITALSIRPELQQQADTWWRENATGNCIGVHYRGTEAIHSNRGMIMDDYIVYLRKVLDGTSCILACSDQDQFITRMNTEFPGRVISRAIQRSRIDTSLHLSGGGLEQKQDAFMDILALAKTQLIYTNGSFFVDCVRFFNPEIKIISLRGSHDDTTGKCRISNYIPIPEKDFALKIKREAKAWRLSHSSRSDR